MTTDIKYLEKLARLIRYYILVSTTEAGSGHPTSSLSAVELMTALFFGGIFRFELEDPALPNNDRLIFSKGHASPLLYALYAAAGKIEEAELLTLRKFGSRLEGHPTSAFPYAEAATGSLGQGLSIGVGMALNAKYLDKLPYRTYVLMGDGETAEGQVWEAIEIGAYYELNNLIGIIDVNRLGQSGATMYGRDLDAYAARVGSFGWETITVDGHSFNEIFRAFEQAQRASGPIMIIAGTVKGKGFSIFEDKDGWHGKTLKREQLGPALAELGEVDKTVRGDVARPDDLRPPASEATAAEALHYKIGERVATRLAYGRALVRLGPKFPRIVSLDAEVNNSTYAGLFKEAYPERFFQMFIAEQNMVSAAVGLSRRGKIPFVSTFACFLSRAYDQTRMSQYSDANIKFAGSHAGVSIGEDGPSQMALEDIALYRSILKSSVLYPADAVAAEKLVEAAASVQGLVYIRLTRADTPVIYDNVEDFPIGGAKVLRQSGADIAAVVAAGITLHEALAAYEELKKEGIFIRVIDLYSIKPIDVSTLKAAAAATGAVITVEDHFPAGGLGEAVKSAISDVCAPVYSLCVAETPASGKPEELLDSQGISRKAIIAKVKEIVAVA